MNGNLYFSSSNSEQSNNLNFCKSQIAENSRIIDGYIKELKELESRLLGKDLEKSVA